MPVKMAAIAAIVLGICAGLFFFTMGDAPKTEQAAVPPGVTQAPPAPVPTEGFFKIVADAEVPQDPFLDGAGRETRLADFQGRTVVLNFWATWCAPCVKELPSLARLQARQGDDGLVVLAVNLDRKLEDRSVKQALAEYGAETLEPYVDGKQTLMRAFRLAGLPTTILIGPDGRELGRREGEAEWDSDLAIAEIERLVAGR